MANIETRPWGTFEYLTRGMGYLVKRLTVRPRQCTSLQYHVHRAEHLTIVEGEAQITVGVTSSRHAVGDSITIPRRAKHRIECVGMGALTIIEVWTGSELDEGDIVRIEDNYGRVTKSG